MPYGVLAVGETGCDLAFGVRAGLAPGCRVCGDAGVSWGFSGVRVYGECPVGWGGVVCRRDTSGEAGTGNLFGG